MIIILEGSDGCGKDTFASELHNKLGYKIVRGSSFEMSKNGGDKLFEESLKILDEDNIIMNRSFYSNLVYGKLYSYPMMKKEQYLKLLNVVNNKAIVVYLHADNNIIKSRLYNRGDDMVKVSDIDDIISEYRNILFNSEYTPKNKFIINNNKKEDIDIGTSFIEKYVKLFYNKVLG